MTGPDFRRIFVPEAGSRLATESVAHSGCLEQGPAALVWTTAGLRTEDQQCALEPRSQRWLQDGFITSGMRVTSRAAWPLWLPGPASVSS